MCPKNLYHLVLLGFVCIFAVYWLKRQRNRAIQSFSAFSQFLEMPKVISRFFGMTLCLSGMYQTRKFGWDYNIFHEENELQIYLKPKCSIQLKTFMFSYPRPTPKTYMRGSKVYFSMRFLKGSFLSRLRSADPIPLLSREDAQHILEELTKSAEIVEKNPRAFGKNN